MTADYFDVLRVALRRGTSPIDQYWNSAGDRYTPRSSAITSGVRIFAAQSDAIGQTFAADFWVPLTTRGLVGVMFITLVACANVSNILLARNHSRRAELAVRFAMGARRHDIVMPLLIDMVLLCLTSALGAVVLARWLPNEVLRQLMQDLPPELVGTLTIDVGVDTSVLLWLAATLLSYQTIVSVVALCLAGCITRSTSVVAAIDASRAMQDISVLQVTTDGAASRDVQTTAMFQAAGTLRSAGPGPVVGVRTPMSSDNMQCSRSPGTTLRWWR
jgi:hypothetical protein